MTYTEDNICRWFKLTILLFLSSISVTLYAQEAIPDTILVKTELGHMTTDTTRYYVIHGSREMVIDISSEKKDTVFIDEISDDIRTYYQRELDILKIRALPIEKVYANMVFDYFTIGESIESVTKRLGKKKIQETYTGYQVSFYDKFSKKNEVFDFEFRGGKLWTIQRQSTNTLPTNDVWEAFELVQIEENLNNLENACKALNKKTNSKKSKSKKRKSKRR